MAASAILGLFGASALAQTRAYPRNIMWQGSGAAVPLSENERLEFFGLDSIFDRPLVS